MGTATSPRRPTIWQLPAIGFMVAGLALVTTTATVTER